MPFDRIPGPLFLHPALPTPACQPMTSDSETLPLTHHCFGVFCAHLAMPACCLWSLIWFPEFPKKNTQFQPGTFFSSHQKLARFSIFVPGWGFRSFFRREEKDIPKDWPKNWPYEGIGFKIFKRSNIKKNKGGPNHPGQDRDTQSPTIN